MMGYSHAVSGTAAWLALTAAVPGAAAVGGFETVGILTGAVVAAGAALLPDIDHHNGTIAHSLPPISGPATKLIGSLTGGHRKYTHTLWGLLFVVIVSEYLLNMGRVTIFGHEFLWIGILMAMPIAFALNALKLTKGKASSWILSALVTAAVITFAAPERSWLPLALGVGYLAHLIGDVITTQGITPFLPLKTKVRLPILGEAGSARERWLTIAMALYIAVVTVDVVATELTGQAVLGSALAPSLSALVGA